MHIESGEKMRSLDQAIVRRCFRKLAILYIALLAQGVACAQDLPKKAVRLLVLSAAGGPSDFVARLIAPKLGEAIDRNVIVDARGSVSGIVATEIAAHAAATRYPSAYPRRIA